MIKEEIKLFKETFFEEPTFLLDTGGRLEISGNHTDHNHGLCLVANCSLRCFSAIKLSEEEVKIVSKGYRPYSFNYLSLNKEKKEEGKTIALTKGVMYYLKSLGYKIGAFKMSIVSDIPDGSGVSSSAAIESLFGYAISYLFNEGKISPLEIAKAGQFAENVYFNKPCGLLDQIGTSFNSSNFINFKNIDNPIIETMDFNLPLSLFLIKSEGNHSSLTNLYAEIPSSMKEVAKLLDNKDYLADVTYKDDILERIDQLDTKDSIKRKGKHFFIENENVKKVKDAINKNDVDLFLEGIRLSQLSSKENLENTFVKGEFSGSPQSIIDDCTLFLKENGAIRIHGGGFKGTVLAFVKNEFSEKFYEYILSKYKKERVFKVEISHEACNFKKL